MNRLVKVKLALVDKDHLLATRTVTDASGQWVGKITALTENLRAIGLDRRFERGGIKITISDSASDGVFKTLMSDPTNQLIANKVATIYIYKPNDIDLQETIVAGIVSWDRDQDNFVINCEQTFAGKLPQTPPAGTLKIDAATWPRAPKKSLGQEVTYPMGVIAARRGGMICYQVDRLPVSKYLITWSDPAFAARVVSLQYVFQAGAKLKSSQYSLVRDANGWEYISYPRCMALLLKANLTANASLFSAGNPVDSLREGLTALAITLNDAGNVFKTFCTTNGWSIVGAPIDFKTVLEYIEFWCANFDCFYRIDPDESITIKHLDWASITSVATLTDQHFEEFKETAKMQGFANRIKASLEYNYAKNEWGTTEIVDSTAVGYTPATFGPVEIPEEYAIASFSGAVKPMASKLKYIDHPLTTAVGKIKQDLYEQLALNVIDVVTISHENQIGGSGKYLILRESKDVVSGDIIVTAHRLWGA